MQVMYEERMLYQECPHCGCLVVCNVIDTRYGVFNASLFVSPHYLFSCSCGAEWASIYPETILHFTHQLGSFVFG